MKLRHIYLALCVAGTVIPYAWFAPWIAANGLDIPMLFRELFSTRAGGFFGLDVLVSALVLVVFVASEHRRLPVRGAWLAVLATFAVGVSLGLPLYLYLRERALERGAAGQG